MLLNNYPLYCQNCYWVNKIKVPLKLRIIQVNDYDATFAKAAKDEKEEFTGEILPTFDVETGGGYEDWEAKFVCPNCRAEEWLLNQSIIYDEENDRLYIPTTDPDDPLGWKKPETKEQGPEELPKIQHLRDVLIDDKILTGD